MSKIKAFFKLPILMNVTDRQREELKNIIGEKFGEFSQAKTYSKDHNPMDCEKWDHWSIYHNDEEGFKLGTVSNYCYIREDMDYVCEGWEPVSFEAFKFICIALTNQ